MARMGWWLVLATKCDRIEESLCGAGIRCAAFGRGKRMRLRVREDMRDVYQV